jgi:hypothetical protein
MFHCSVLIKKCCTGLVQHFLSAPFLRKMPPSESLYGPQNYWDIQSLNYTFLDQEYNKKAPCITGRFHGQHDRLF